MYYVVDMTGRCHPWGGSNWYKKEYATIGAARGVATRLNKVSGAWKAIHVDDYLVQYPVKMVERINLMSGEAYMEAEDTPLFLSPSSETFWSM